MSPSVSVEKLSVVVTVAVTPPMAVVRVIDVTSSVMAVTDTPSMVGVVATMPSEVGVVSGLPSLTEFL